jgi:hypothetical protein
MAAVASISTRNGNSLCSMMRFTITKDPRLSRFSTLPSCWKNKGASAATSAGFNSWFAKSQTIQSPSPFPLHGSRVLVSSEQPHIFSAKRQERRLFSTSRRYHSTTSTNPTSDPLLPHDLGGNMSVYGPIPALETLLVWEQQCHSLLILLSAKKIFKTDEFRRSIESLTPEQYNEWSYYEKWSAGMTNLLLEKKILTPDELQRALWGETTPDDTTSPPFCFQVGDSVRVKRYHDVPNEWKRPHIRTPGYVYGVSGTIERICGRHGDPSYLAFGLQTPPLRQLYRVRFRMQDLWPEQDAAFGKETTKVGKGGDQHDHAHVVL